MYAGLVVPPLVGWDPQNLRSAMLWLTGLIFICFAVVFINYCVLTCSDPVDPLIPEANLSQTLSQNDLKTCSLCERKVSKGTEHCLSCNRCTGGFDHHSQLINNCISLSHMKHYMSLNVCFTLAMGLVAGQTTALFVLCRSDTQLAELVVNKWALMVLIVLTLLSFLFSTANTLFTIYLRCKDITRIDYKYRDTDSNNSDFSEEGESEEKVDN